MQGLSSYDQTIPRLFRLRVRRGLVSIGITAPLGDSPPSARGGDEIVVPEEVAAGLFRLRAVDLIEIIEDEDAVPPVTN